MLVSEWPLFLSVSLSLFCPLMKIKCQCGSLIFWVQWSSKETKAVHFSFKSKDSLGGSHTPKSSCESYGTDLKDRSWAERKRQKKKRDRDQGGGRETGPICFISTWVLQQKWTLVSGVAAEGRCRLRKHLWSHAGLSLEGGAAGPQLGWTPAGQLCGTAAIVEQNSFLITHLASQFNRKYSSCIFFSLSLNLKEIRKEKLIFSLNNWLFADLAAGSAYQVNQ